MAGIPLDSLELTDEDTGRMEREREIRVFLQFCIRNKTFFESRNHKLCKGFARKPHLLIDSIEDWKREGR